jgi:hypothetical protein
LRAGKNEIDDDFVEVQVFGPLTARTLESVSICSKGLKGKATRWKVVKTKLEAVGVRTSEV